MPQAVNFYIPFIINYSPPGTKIWSELTACYIFAHGKNKFLRQQDNSPLKIFR